MRRTSPVKNPSVPSTKTTLKNQQITSFEISASSAKSVGVLRLREVVHLMVKGNAQMLEVPISKGSSHRVAYF